jgi:sulfatase maturation enzyme AslB (radical SAM superfamily)
MLRFEQRRHLLLRGGIVDLTEPLTILTPAAEAVSFRGTLAAKGHPRLARSTITTLQVNVGKRCNMACHHCHVAASPKRTEEMERKTAKRVLQLLEKNPSIETLDLTGGAPELNPHFRYLVRSARQLGRTGICP